MNLLDGLFGTQVPLVAKMLVAFGVIFGLLALFWFVGRRFVPGPRIGVAGGRGRQPRLGVLDAHAVDARRKLVLIRRDNVEHLIMIGGPNDVVIESTILRGRPQARPGQPQLPLPPGSAGADRGPPAAAPQDGEFEAERPPEAPMPPARSMEAEMAAQLEQGLKRQAPPAPPPVVPVARPARPQAPPPVAETAPPRPPEDAADIESSLFGEDHGALQPQRGPAPRAAQQPPPKPPETPPRPPVAPASVPPASPAPARSATPAAPQGGSAWGSPRPAPPRREPPSFEVPRASVADATPATLSDGARDRMTDIAARPGAAKPAPPPVAVDPDLDDPMEQPLGLDVRPPARQTEPVLPEPFRPETPRPEPRIPNLRVPDARPFDPPSIDDFLPAAATRVAMPRVEAPPIEAPRAEAFRDDDAPSPQPVAAARTAFPDMPARESDDVAESEAPQMPPAANIPAFTPRFRRESRPVTVPTQFENDAMPSAPPGMPAAMQFPRQEIEPRHPTAGQEPAPAAPAGPAVAPGPAARPQPAPAVQPDPFASLEEEMASLLGRSSGTPRS